MKPASVSPLRNAAKKGAYSSADEESRYPMIGIASCCAPAATGQKAAAPPARLMKSRRLMDSPPGRRLHPSTVLNENSGVRHSKLGCRLAAMGPAADVSLRLGRALEPHYRNLIRPGELQRCGKNRFPISWPPCHLSRREHMPWNADCGVAPKASSSPDAERSAGDA